MLRRLRTAVSGGPARLKLDQQEIFAEATSLSASIGQAKVNRLQDFCLDDPKFHDYLRHVQVLRTITVQSTLSSVLSVKP